MSEEGVKSHDSVVGDEENQENVVNGSDFGSSEGNSKPETGQNEPQVPDETQEALIAENSELKDKYLRLLAEFDNYKKNVAKQRAELLKYQGQAIVSDLLEVLDNFEFAINSSNSAPSEATSTDGAPVSTSVLEGIGLIHKSFLDTLEKWGIKGEDSVGTAFDPNKHSALGMVEDAELEPGTVKQELRRAFYYKDRLIRHAEVVVVKEST